MRLMTVLVAVILCAASARGGVVVGDLANDWSDTSNGGGDWAYRHGDQLLPHVDWFARDLGEFDVPQPAWARSESGTDRLPTWFKAVATPVSPPDVYDWQVGDVIVHSTDPDNGIGGGIANVTWTSPIDGDIDILGGVWQARDIGRSNQWSLYLNGMLLSQGDLFTGDPYSRANPFEFGNGSGGANALTGLVVNTGDVLTLAIARTGSAPGDFVGVNLRIEANVVPEAGSLVIWLLTIASAVAIYWRRR